MLAGSRCSFLGHHALLDRRLWDLGGVWVTGRPQRGPVVGREEQGDGQGRDGASVRPWEACPPQRFTASGTRASRKLVECHIQMLHLWMAGGPGELPAAGAGGRPSCLHRLGEPWGPGDPDCVQQSESSEGLLGCGPDYIFFIKFAK